LIIEKECTNCKEVQNVVFFHRKLSSPDGYSPWCVRCRKITAEQQLVKTGKQCSLCGKFKLRDKSFTLDARLTDGLRDSCKSCDVEMKNRSSSYWKDDPVDYGRIIEHFGLSESMHLKDSELVSRWNDETDLSLPRESDRDKPLLNVVTGAPA